MRAQSRDVDGVQMQWGEAGAGPPVVFLHGLPTSPSLWRHVLPRVVGARCLAWEMVGYGASIPAGRGRDLSVRRQADYLAGWMEALALEPVLLVGHDLGGGVAQIMAVHHPERVRALVLTNCICYDAWPVPSVKLLRALGPIVARLPAAFLYLVFSVLFWRGHDDPGQAKEALRVHTEPYLEAGGLADLVRQMEDLDAHDTLAVAGALPALGKPARIVWGAADSFLPVTYGARLARDLDAPLDRIEGGRHFVPEDHPERIAAAVMDLLESVPPSQSKRS